MYVNKTHYFDPIPPEVHEYQIGGYQVNEALIDLTKINMMYNVIIASQDLDPQYQQKIIPLIRA